MTPSDIETAARQRYNSVGDNLWSQQEIFDLIYAACLELSAEGLVIENLYSTSTVASQQEYDFPTNTIAIKRLTYNGNKLEKITFREDDALTLSNSATTATGAPQYYAEWNQVLYLRPVPDGVGTLKIFSYNQPATITVSSTIEVPKIHHMKLVDFILAEMHAKEKNYDGYTLYRQRWEKNMERIVRFEAARKRTDSFTSVKDEELLPMTYLGLA